MTNPALTTTLTMSNREIADITGKRPDHVARDIRDMLAALYDGVADDFLPENILKNQQSPISASGYGVSQYGVNAAGLAVYQYNLDKDHTLALIAGYNVKARFAVAEKVASLGLDVWQLFKDIDFDPLDAADFFIYAIQEGTNGPIKLGVSKDPERRLAQLQVGNSSTLHIVATMPAPARYADEALIHSNASEYHIRGEWFLPKCMNVVQ